MGGYPFAAAMNASPMPVLPDVGSTKIVLPATHKPSRPRVREEGGVGDSITGRRVVPMPRARQATPVRAGPGRVCRQDSSWSTSSIGEQPF